MLHGAMIHMFHIVHLSDSRRRDRHRDELTLTVVSKKLMVKVKFVAISQHYDSNPCKIFTRF